MAITPVRSLILGVLLACLALSGPAFSGPARRQGQTKSDLTVHEWGTFTSIADRNGNAVKWAPSSNPADLPEFVEHYRTADYKSRLLGTVRMETPVLYFYSSAETTLSVRVGFSKGVITEWYPHASHVEPDPRKLLPEDELFDGHRDGGITWDAVTVEPGLAASFPSDGSQAHYYAARETSAAPVTVRTRKGLQQEKFLFYRGVSVFPIPVAAQSVADGRVLVKSLGPDEIPNVILFERRGDRIGYRISGALQGEMQIDPPELTATLESLASDLEGILIAQGLYADEARAMVETWKLSWFEEGSRVLYIVPPKFVDEVLPLSIAPGPSQTVRAFVGRLELITPTTEKAVETALAEHDRLTISKYGRFLEPIMEQLKVENPARAQELDENLMKTYQVELPDPPAR